MIYRNFGYLDISISIFPIFPIYRNFLYQYPTPIASYSEVSRTYIAAGCVWRAEAIDYGAMSWATGPAAS